MAANDDASTPLCDVHYEPPSHIVLFSFLIRKRKFIIKGVRAERDASCGRQIERSLVPLVK